MIKTLKRIQYHDEQIDHLVSAKESTFVGTILAPFFSVYLLSNFLNTMVIISLVLIHIVSFLLRIKLANKILKITNNHEKNILLKQYLIHLFFSAATTGIYFIFIITHGEENFVLLYFLGISLISLAAIISLSPVYHAILIYIQTIMLFCMYGFLFIGDSQIYDYMVFGILLFMIIFIFSTYKVYGLLTQNILIKEDLKETNESFKHLLDVTMEAIVIIDESKNTIIQGNKSAIKLFNLENKSQIIDLSLFMFLPKQEESKLLDLFKNDHNEPQEFELNTLDGQGFPSLLSTKKMKINAKNIIVLSILDLTQIKQKEQQLYTQSKLASMGEMIGSISHQWRQPLSAISILSSGVLINEDIKREDLESSMEKIIVNTDFLSTTINTFTNFLKPNKIKEDVIIESKVQEMFLLFTPTLKNNNITFSSAINSDINNTPIKIHSNELAQVIINLVNNAKDALLENEIQNPWVKIDIEYLETEIIISIEDNAGGIPADINEKIFEPYFTTKHQSFGTGLGLHMSYNLVSEGLDGTLYNNNTQEGSKFFIRIPIV